MHERPDLPDEKIVASLRDEYALSAARVEFLPLGADRHTAVYRAIAQDGASYFVKLRRGAFDDTCVALPRFLSEQGIKYVIPPLVTNAGKLWATMDAFKLILYPWVDGRNGYEVSLTDRHWQELGAALKRIHATIAPADLAKSLPREDYSSEWREQVKAFVTRSENESFDEPVASELAAFLRSKRSQVLELVERADHLARTLSAHPPEFVLCHHDVHAGNILIAADGALYIVDWDDPIFAPKERDLICAGSGLFAWRTPREEEERLFYEGYGRTQVDAFALAYYRYERIVEDIAAFSEQIFLTNGASEDRAQALIYLKSNFLPNNTIELAYQADRTRRRY
jgi:spectinomycin phosphotransferase